MTCMLSTATHDIKVGGVTNELREVKVQQDIVSQVSYKIITMPQCLKVCL